MTKKKTISKERLQSLCTSSRIGSMLKDLRRVNDDKPKTVKTVAAPNKAYPQSQLYQDEIDRNAKVEENIKKNQDQLVSEVQMFIKSE